MLLIKDGADLKKLNSLDQKESGRYTVMLVKEKEFGSRGIDYRSPLVGICMMVLTPFANSIQLR